jgi:DNA-binding transcriptional LysR family regulator
MSKLEQLTAFITVVESSSFVAAAKKLGISTAAISRQVSRLEALLKIELLHRTTRQVSLTEMGEQYYHECKKALNELDDAEMAILSSQQEATGTLRITSSRYFAMKYLIPELPKFMVLNPKLQVKLELAERFPDLAFESVDLIFGVSIEGSPELVRKRIATTRYILCASPAYIKKHGLPKIPADLNNHFYITHSIRKPDNVIRFKNNKEIYVDPSLWLNDSLAIRECAIQNMGIVQLHDYIIADDLKNGKLIEVLKDFQEKEVPIYLYYQQSRYLQPKIRRFIDFYAKI